MANFEEAHKKFITSQGQGGSHISDSEDSSELLCSECFHDEGMKLMQNLLVSTISQIVLNVTLSMDVN